jgi:tRNA G18 (ribose-2'-O)-methylase SpoU
LDDYEALNDPARRRQIERRGAFFIVEGTLAVEALLGSPYPVRSVLVTRGKEPAVRDALTAHGRDGVPVLVRPDDEVAAITGFAFHRGVLASADRLPLRPPSELVAGTSGARRLAVLEGLNDHENVGALFRNAAAFGVDAVLADPTTADPLYRRSVRVSLGHVLRVPWTRIADWPDGLAELRAAGFVLVALTPAAGAEPIDALAAAPPERLALLLGAEGPGLSAAALAAADRRVRIPIAAGVDSLNVATAAAIAFHRLW